MSATAAQVQHEIDSWSGGSDGRTRHPFNRRFIYTEGVKAVADLAGAYWMLDIVATEVAPIALKLWDDEGDGMSFLKFDVNEDCSCTLTLDDGNDDVVHWTRRLEYTDFPAGRWSFYLAIDGVIEHPKEVLVMLLPTEY